MIKIGGNNATFKVGSSDCSIYLGSIKLYPTGSHDYSRDYFTIVSDANGNTIQFNYNLEQYEMDEIYVSGSTDDGATWETYHESDSVTLNTGDKLLLKSENPYGWYYGGVFNGENNYHVEGNIMSLLYGDDFIGKTSFPEDCTENAFYQLFQNESRLTGAQNLILPATTLVGQCYDDMFYGCTSLTTAPALPATTLQWNCYQGMFQGCRSLTTAPALPATSLAQSCYQYMFSGCTSLTSAPTLASTSLADNCYEHMFADCTSITTAPVLPATTLRNYCYSNMFRGCTGLTSAPVLSATTLQQYCYSSMFAGCTSLTSAPTLASTSLTNSCYNSMFKGCTSLTTAPALPATTLAGYCYSSMFSGCTGLTSAPVLSATTLQQYCYSNMFAGCTSLTTAPDLPALTLQWGSYLQMFDGCTSLNYIRCLATNISANSSTLNWLGNVSSSGTFVKTKTMTSWTRGANGIPSTWSIVNDGEVDYSKTYFTIVSETDGNSISIAKNGTPPSISISYSTDSGSTWTAYASGDTISLNTGDKVLFKGVNTSLATSSLDQNSISGTKAFHAEGNTMSLLYGDSFTGQTSLSGRNFALSGLFRYNSYLTGAENLILPAITLSDGCYSSMFAHCYGLTTSPALPATVTTPHCYEMMFQSCLSLTTPPALYASSMTNSCYNSMFYNCTGLTSAPVLSATTLDVSCYESMFAGCRNLASAPALPAVTLASSCYSSMFQGCTSLTTAPALSATALISSCYSNMFKGCSGITTAPELSASTLVSNCYYGMFDGCSSLNYIKCLATDISVSNCTTNWTKDVASSGTFVKNANMSSWLTGVNGIPVNWTVSADTHDYSQDYFTIVSESNNNTVNFYLDDFGEAISASTNGGSSWTEYRDWGGEVILNNGDKLLIKAVKNDWGDASPIGGVSGDFHVEGNIMSLLYGDNFTGQTSLAGRDYAFAYLLSGFDTLTSAENLILPATTLEGGCYQSMFYGCYNLTTAPVLPATTLSDYCYKGMFESCSSLNYIKCLATNINAESCTEYWVVDVSPTGTFVKAASMNDWETGDNGIPEDWTVTNAS